MIRRDGKIAGGITVVQRLGQGLLKGKGGNQDVKVVNIDVAAAPCSHASAHKSSLAAFPIDETSGSVLDRTTPYIQRRQ